MTEKELQAQVAMSCRLMDAAQVMDFNGHVSARLPGTDRIYINSKEKGRATLTAEDIICVDLDGKLLEGKGTPPSETPIHLAVYRRRPDVGCVAHLHPMIATAFSIAGAQLFPVFVAGGVLGGPVPVYDEPDLITTMEQADDLAKVLGDKRACLMRGHGAVTVGRNVEEVLAVSVFLEENAKKQLYASMLGQPRAFTAEENTRLTAQVWTESIIHKIWTYYQEKMGLA